MWKESAVDVQRLKAGTKIIKITKRRALKQPLGLTPQHNVSWREVRATAAGRVQEKRRASSRGKMVLAHSKVQNERKEVSKCQAFSGVWENGLFHL